jgi:outer membrane lipoprotein SlyB
VAAAPVAAAPVQPVEQPIPPPPAGTPPAPPPDVVATVPPPVCADCGVVNAVRAVKAEGNATGAGAVAGGVVGAILGNQVGQGHGREAARVVGILGGALAGHEIEKQARATTTYQVDVRMDSGEVRTVALPGDPGLIIGQRVHLQGNQIRVDPAVAPRS